MRGRIRSQFILAPLSLCSHGTQELLHDGQGAAALGLITRGVLKQLLIRITVYYRLVVKVISIYTTTTKVHNHYIKAHIRVSLCTSSFSGPFKCVT